MNKILIICIILVLLFSGCLDHGWYTDQKVKTTQEWNIRANVNSSFIGTVVLVVNTRNGYNYDQFDHYSITVYNKTLNSKRIFDENDLAPYE